MNSENGHLIGQPPHERGVDQREIIIDPEKYNVLCAVYDMTGRVPDFGKYIVEQQLFHGMNVGVTGEPATGKTAFLLQLGECVVENAKRLGIEKELRYTQYDIELYAEKIFWEEKLKKLGQTGLVISSIEGVDFNRKLRDACLLATDFELPAVGKKDPKNRGRDAFEDIARGIGEGRDTKTILISFPANPIIQSQGGNIRRYIANLPVEEVFDGLRKHNMNMQGIPQTLEYAEGIQKMFADMGQEEHITQIKLEEMSIQEEWEERRRKAREAGEEVKDYSLILKEENYEEALLLNASAFDLPLTDDVLASLLKKAETARDQTLRQAAKMKDDFRILKVPDDRGFVVGNKFVEGLISINVSQLLQRSAINSG